MESAHGVAVVDVQVRNMAAVPLCVDGRVVAVIEAVNVPDVAVLGEPTYVLWIGHAYCVCCLPTLHVWLCVRVCVVCDTTSDARDTGARDEDERSALRRALQQLFVTAAPIIHASTCAHAAAASSSATARRLEHRLRDEVERSRADAAAQQQAFEAQQAHAKEVHEKLADELRTSMDDAMGGAARQLKRMAAVVASLDRRQRACNEVRVGTFCLACAVHLTPTHTHPSMFSRR